MQRFKSLESAQQFLTSHTGVYNTFSIQRHQLSRRAMRLLREALLEPGEAPVNLTAPFHVFLQHKALSDRRRDDAIPEPLGQLSQRPPAGAVRRGDQLEVEGL